MRIPGIRIECLIAILRQNTYMHEQITKGFGIMKCAESGWKPLWKPGAYIIYLQHTRNGSLQNLKSCTSLTILKAEWSPKCLNGQIWDNLHSRKYSVLFRPNFYILVNGCVSAIDHLLFHSPVVIQRNVEKVNLSRDIFMHASYHFSSHDLCSVSIHFKDGIWSFVTNSIRKDLLQQASFHHSINTMWINSTSISLCLCMFLM